MTRAIAILASAVVLCTTAPSSFAKPPATTAGALTQPLGPQPRNRVLQEHTGSVLWVAFAADGNTLASGSRDDRVIVWDVASGKPLHVLTQPSDDVYCVAYSPDGTLLAACSADNRVYIWNVPSYELKEIFHGDAVLRNLSFSPDGKLLACGGYDKEVWIWDLTQTSSAEKKRKPFKNFHGYSGNVKAVEFSADGKMLLTGGMQSQVLIWDPLAKPNRLLQTLDSPEKSYEAIAMSPDQKVVVGNSSYGPLVVWDISSGRILKTLTGHVLEGDSLAFRPDGKILASGNKDQTITLWDTQTWEPVAVFTGNKGRIESITFSPDGKTLANGGGGGDSSIKLWDLSGLQLK